MKMKMESVEKKTDGFSRPSNIEGEKKDTEKMSFEKFYLLETLWNNVRVYKQQRDVRHRGPTPLSVDLRYFQLPIRTELERLKDRTCSGSRVLKPIASA